MVELVRPMSTEDVSRCLTIEAQTYPLPWTEGVFLDELVAPGRAYLVMEVDGLVVGYGGVMLVLPEAHVTSVTIDPEFRGRDLGTKVMLALAEEARRAGAKSLTLEVRASNKNAQSLYTKFGMAPVGIRKRYYRDEDALIMWVHDIDRQEYEERLESIRAALGSELAS
jgi:ribosomal-protein-alanine N-acetyltransferase